jgi:CHAT domain-containing protein
MGLQHAFQYAGARSVLVSLLKVDDSVTAMLMEDFYRNLWQQDLPKLEALRQAQLAILRHPERLQRPSPERGIVAKMGPDQRMGHGTDAHQVLPSLWAGFVLYGDGR